MTTEMNPSPVTVTNPAEKPGTPDVTPVGPSPLIAEKIAEAGCCGTSAKSDAKSESESCSTVKPGASVISPAGPPAIKPESVPDSGCCDMPVKTPPLSDDGASTASETGGKPAGSCTN